MADRFEFKKDGPCLIAVTPDYVLPSGNVRAWTIDSHGMFFGDELLIGKIMECGVRQACSSRRVFPDFASFSEEDFKKACADAVRKVLDMYYYRTVPA